MDLTGAAAPAAGPSGAAPGSRRGQAVCLLVLAALACYAPVAVPVFRQAIQSHFAIGMGELGILLSSGAIPGALGTLLAGYLCHRRRPGAALRWALAGVAAASLLAAAARQWLLFLLAMMATSLCTGMLALAVPCVLAAQFPRRQRQVLALQLAATGLVAALYAVLAEWLYDLAVGRRAVSLALALHGPYVALAGVFALGAALVRVRPAAEPAEASPPPDTAAGHPDPQPPRPEGPALGRLVFLAALIAVHVTSDNAAAAWMPRVLGGRSFPAERIAPGLVMAGASLAYVVSRLLLAALPDRIGRRKMLALPGLLGGAVLLAGLASRQQAHAGAAYVAASFCWSLEYPVFLATAAAIGPRALARALAWGGVAGAAGTFLLTAGMGWVGQALGEERLWLILAGPACGFLLVGLLGGVYLRAFARRSASC